MYYEKEINEDMNMKIHIIFYKYCELYKLYDEDVQKQIEINNLHNWSITWKFRIHLI